jgi:hypothetical protein
MARSCSVTAPSSSKTTSRDRWAARWHFLIDRRTSGLRKPQNARPSAARCAPQSLAMLAPCGAYVAGDGSTALPLSMPHPPHSSPAFCATRPSGCVARPSRAGCRRRLARVWARRRASARRGSPPGCRDRWEVDPGGAPEGADCSSCSNEVSTAGSEATEERSELEPSSGRGLPKAVAVAVRTRNPQKSIEDLANP